MSIRVIVFFENSNNQNESKKEKELKHEIFDSLSVDSLCISFYDDHRKCACQINIYISNIE